MILGQLTTSIFLMFQLDPHLTKILKLIPYGLDLNVKGYIIFFIPTKR